MSSPNQARRVTAQIFFQGADITGSMRPYFLVGHLHRQGGGWH